MKSGAGLSILDGAPFTKDNLFYHRFSGFG
jgi:hypothetical protein